MYLIFKTTKERDLVFNTLLQLVGSDCITTETNIWVHTQQWVNSQISNFDYLMILNSYAQRSF